MDIPYAYALVLAIGAITLGTIIRTFLPLFIKIRAEFDLAQKEGRDPVVPKISNIWLYMAGINIILLGFPLFATIDTYVKPILDATGIFAGFFTIVAVAMATNEGLNRLADSGISSLAPKG